MRAIRRVGHIVEHLGQGGIPRVVLGVAEGMAAQGVETHILMLKERVEFPVDPALELRTLALDGLSRGSWFGKPLRRLGRGLLGPRRYAFLASPWFCRQLARELAGEPFDALFFHGLPVVWPLHRWRGDNALFVLHNIKSAQLRESSAALTRYQFRAFARVLAAKRLIAVSAGVKADLVAHFVVAPGAVAVVDNPFDTAAIRQRAQEAPHDCPPTGEFLLFVGRLAAQKRVDLLLRAHARAGLGMPLLILGDGPLRDEHEALTRTLGLDGQVRFLGFRDNPYPYMARARALVMCSDFEGFGNVLVEALACGTRVVASRVGVAEALLQGELAAGLVPPGDEAALAAKLGEVAEGALVPGDDTMLARFTPRAVADAYLRLASES